MQSWFAAGKSSIGSCSKRVLWVYQYLLWDWDSWLAILGWVYQAGIKSFRAC